MTHTPGPFMAHWTEDGGAFVSGGKTAIADMTGPRPHQRSNAKLFAATLDLLEAARMVIAYDEAEHADDVLMMMEYADMMKKARSAVEKAEGRS